MPGTIHDSAIVSAAVELGSGVTIGPYAYLEEGVVVGDNCIIDAYVHLKKGTRMGSGNHVHSHAVIGGEPQHMAYKGEDTETVLGDNNNIREFVTINRGMVMGNGKTELGSGCLLMAYAHVAHDCVLGNNVIMANAVNLAGHVEIGNHAIISGLVGCQQFLRVGEYAFLGGSSGYNLDIPPYMLAHGVRGRLMGPNLIGLKRHGFTSEACRALKKAYKIIFRSGQPREKAIEQALEEFDNVAEVVNMIDFIRSSKNGVAPDYHKNDSE